jgi:cytochrome P450
LQRSYAAGYHGHLESETHRFLSSLLGDSPNYDSLIDQYLGRITCLLGWGTSDPVVPVADNAHTFMYSLSPAGPLANALPALMWFPEWMVRSKKMERHRHTEEERLFTELLERATRDAVGRSSPSYARTLLDKGPNFAPREAAYAVGMMANVAILTTGSPLRTFLLAMVLHPDWQRALREEVDTVIGEEDRLVGLNDAPRLPILRAIIKECFRWRPVIPTGIQTLMVDSTSPPPSARISIFLLFIPDFWLGIPHELEKDDIWNGYFIPKGAYIHAVEWFVLEVICAHTAHASRSLARDPAAYPDPDAFNPARYLDPNYPTYREPLSEFPTIRGYHGFGFGRRICPGQEVAEAELLVACAALAWAFRLEKKRLPRGPEVPVNDYDFTCTLITTAKPFEMEFKVRSEKHAQSILDRSRGLKAAELNSTAQK